MQQEIEADCGVDFTGRTKNKHDRQKVNYRKGFEADPKFLQIWDKIKFHSKYCVDYKTDDLISEAAKAMTDELQMPATRASAIRSSTYGLTMTDEGIGGNIFREKEAVYNKSILIPDALGYIQNKTALTRETILQILKKSGRINELLVNPQMFLDNAVTIIKEKLQELMINGIRYEKIGSQFYEMALFDDSDFEFYFDKKTTFVVNDSSKTVYENFIPLDSETVEMPFAKECESREDIEFYFKLPKWFKINTPIGTYNPDWALVLKNEKKIYFIAETKGYQQELRKTESLKIKCGIAYFKNLDGIVFRKVSSVREVFD